MGLITDLYGSDWKNIDSSVNQDFINSVEAALGGPGFSADFAFPPSIGGCVDIDFNGLLEESASPELAEAFRTGLDAGYGDFERVFVEGLYDMTLEAIDLIPTGPFALPFVDPSYTVDLSYFDFDCLELPSFMICAVEALGKASSGFDECLCDYLPGAGGSPTDDHLALMEENGYTEDQYCEFFLEWLLPQFSFEIDIPWPPELSFSIPPDFCELFLNPEIECNFELPDISFLLVFEWALTWVWDFAISLPTIAIDLASCFLDEGFEPCGIVSCVVDALVEMMAIDDLFEEINFPISFIAAISVYVQKISIYMIQMVIGFAFGVGVMTTCIGEALGVQ